MKKLTTLFVLALALSCAPDSLDDPTIFERFDQSYISVSDVSNQEGLWTGTMQEFIQSPLYVSGNSYHFDIYTLDCIQPCESYKYCCSFIETIQ